MIKTKIKQYKWYDRVLPKLLNVHNLMGGGRYFEFVRTRHGDEELLSFVNQRTTVLTKLEKREIADLFHRWFNIRYSAHLFYKEKLGYFDKNFIPNGVHSAKIDRYFNDWNKASIIDNKCYYPTIFSGINMPKMVAYRLGGYWYNQDNSLINYSEFITIVAEYKELFFKRAADSWGGLGVHYYNKENESIAELEKCISQMPGDIVVQECIHQGASTAQLNPSSVNTIRIMSMLRKDGSVKILSSILRMGVGDSKVDNASSGGISVGIKENGQLKNVAYSNTGIRYDVHPSSNVHFEEVTIPNFEQMKELVIKLQSRFPYFRLISWDLAVDDNNEPLLIEANLCDGELDFHQLNNGPIFGEDTEAILQEVFTHKRTYNGNNIFVRLLDNIIGAILHEKRFVDLFKYNVL